MGEAYKVDEIDFITVKFESDWYFKVEFLSVIHTRGLILKNTAFLHC